MDKAQSEVEAAPSLLDLPPELLYRILSQIDDDELRSLRCVCRRLKDFIENTQWSDVDFFLRDSRGVYTDHNGGSQVPSALCCTHKQCRFLLQNWIYGKTQS
jgi:hypothetical protein